MTVVLPAVAATGLTVALSAWSRASGLAKVHTRWHLGDERDGRGLALSATDVTERQLHDGAEDLVALEAVDSGAGHFYHPDEVHTEHNREAALRRPQELSVLAYCWRSSVVQPPTRTSFIPFARVRLAGRHWD